VYLLDPPVLAALLNGRSSIVSLTRPWMTRHDVSTSIVVYGEVVEYIKGAADYPSRLATLRTLVREVHPHGLDYATMERYADLRRQLRPPRGPGLIGDMDILIAATALEHDVTLVTMDHDVERVPALKLMLLARRA
jgi:predicted nucleic acid-binding protein